MKTIMIVKPGMFTPGFIKKFEKQGYLIIENDDPNCVKFVAPSLGDLLGSDELSKCILAAIKESDHCTNRLGHHIVNALKQKQP